MSKPEDMELEDTNVPLNAENKDKPEDADHSWMKSIWSKRNKCKILGSHLTIIIGSFIFISVAYLLHQMHHPQHVTSCHPQHVTSSQPQIQHAFFHLKTKGYTELEKDTPLQWTEDGNQVGSNIKLLNGIYIFVPQDAIYEINCVVQLLIPKDTPADIITLMLKRTNNEKIYTVVKKSSSSLKIPEYTRIQLLIKYNLRANDKIFLKMNFVKFISPDTHSSYLSITRFNINNPQ